MRFLQHGHTLRSLNAVAMLSCVSAAAAFMTAPVARVRLNARAAAVMLDVAAPNVMTECLLLPSEPHPGTPPIDMVGEVMLQELEDDEETRTQIFLNADGTISHGATDGPPPAGFCGLWQCGSGKFQMTLSRGFSTPSTMLERGQIGQMVEDISYTVVRIYEGEVDPTSNGVALVNGRIDLVNDDDRQGWAYTDATSIAAYDPFASIDLPPIGYFVLDANTAAELSESPPVVQAPPATWEGKKAPKKDWSLTLGGGVRTVEDVRKDQKKAAKGLYEKDGESDLGRYQKGWTTN